MDSFLLAASVVIPLVVYMTVGYLIKTFHIFKVEYFKALNVVNFKVFIPTSLFFNLYHSGISDAARPLNFVFTGLMLLATFFVAHFFIFRMIPDRADAATMVQGIYRCNYVLFGMSIAASLCDDKGTALIAVLSALVVPMINALSVILFETNRGGEIKPAQIIINIFKNPLVIAGISGAIVGMTGFQLPAVLESPLAQIGNMATPLALITLGGILSFNSMFRHLRYLAIASVSRLVIIPLISILLALALGMRGAEIVAVLTVFGAPTAVASTPMAQTMGGNGELAGEIVAATSVLSLITIFLFVYVLSSTGII